MLTEELGLRLDSPSPLRAAAATFVAFVAVGSIPLLPFLLPGQLAAQQAFLVSASATAVAFYLIGLMRGWVLHRSLMFSGPETLGIGGVAAALAYIVGTWLRGLAGN